MPELTEEHLRRLRNEPDLYSAGALRIVDKNAKLIPFVWNDEQQTLYRRITEQQQRTGKVRVLILKARQLGISTWCASRIFHRCTLWTNRRGFVLADKFDRASDIFAIYERFDRELPSELRPTSKTNIKKRELAWTTDSRITVETAGDPDAGRGSTIGYLHASEIAMWPKAEETFIALMSAVPTDSGEVYLESTAKGVGNLFHRLWLQAETGDSEWLAVFFPWWVHKEYVAQVLDNERQEIEGTEDPWERMALDEGILLDGELHKLQVEQLAWRRKKIASDFLGDERTFRQEYPATAREAFITSGDGFFDAQALEQYEHHTKRFKKRGTFVAAGGGFVFQPSERGWVKVWEEKDPEGHYVIGADTAEGKKTVGSQDISEVDSEQGGRDFSSADILKVSELIEDEGKMIRVPCCRQVAQIHGRMAPEVFATQVFASAAHWACPTTMRSRRRPALTAIERNHSSGQTVLQVLQNRYNHPELFIHRRLNVRGSKVTSYLGWVTDGTTRMPMLDTLGAFIREHEIEINSADTVRELFTFILDDLGKPQAQEGTHDDRVLSLGIALAMLEHHREEPKTQKERLEVFDTPTGQGYVAV